MGKTNLKLFINLREGEPTGIVRRMLLGNGRSQDLSEKEGRDAEEEGSAPRGPEGEETRDCHRLVLRSENETPVDQLQAKGVV